MSLREVSPSRRRRVSPAATLLSGVSALALGLALAVPAQAGDLLKGNRYASPTMSASAAAAALASVKQAQQATAAARNSLAAATRAIQLMQQNQASWRNLSLSTITNVPNGLGADGLQVAPGVGTDPTLWQGAKAPVQTTANGQTSVTIDQTAQKSILTWDSYNVGRDTTVYYNQSAGNQTNGNNNWISLNRIVDPSTSASTILGKIKAEGSVYLINRNGIIFGGSSQVNVHSLVASSLGFLGENIAGLTAGSAQYDAAVSASNAMFLNTTNGGIAAPESTGNTSPARGGNLVLGVGTQLTGTAASNFAPTGGIEIDAGATISTHANGTESDGGFVLIAAPTIKNAGTITTSDGQAILAAGIGVSLVRSPTATQFLIPELTGQITIGGHDVTPVGSLTNTGLIQAATGNVTLLGTNMSLGGVVGVTTSVSRPGSIVISTVDEADIADGSSAGSPAPADRRAGELVVSGTIANLPEEDDQTVPANGSSFTPGSIALTGGSVWLQNGSLIEAPGAKVSLVALSPAGTNAAPGDNGVAGRVYLDNGANVTVAGLSDVELPMSDILVDIPLLGGNELADSPLLRTLLKDLADVIIDSTQAGTRADGLSWVGSPILNAAGYVGLIPAKIDQLLTNGGTVTLSGSQVMTAAGSTINLDGGFVHYLGGYINTTKLLDSAGHVVDIGDADPNDIFVGVANQFVVHHDHWGITETFNTSLTPKGTFRPDFIEGGNAGTLSVFGAQATVLDGMVSATAFPGLQQVAAGEAASGKTPGGSFLPQGGSFILGAASALTFPVGNTLNGETGAIIIRDKAPDLGSLGQDFGAETPLDTSALNALGTDDPDNILAWTTLPADMIKDGGFANVTVTEDKLGGKGLVVAQGTTLEVQPGGSITLNATDGEVDILGSLIATSGNIKVASVGGFSAGGDIVVGPDAVISVAGQWVNDGSLDADTNGADTFVNGGSISLSTSDAITDNTDVTGSILLQAGSVLDVSSGGVLLPGGILEMTDGIPMGKGGDVSLVIYDNSLTALAFGGGDSAPPLPGTQPTAGRLAMDGTIDSWGFAGGGTLTLQALGLQIGGDPTQAPSWDLYLPTDFFAKQGFGSYQLNALYDATVADGAIVDLTQRNLIPNLPALAAAPTGSNLNQDGLTNLGTIDPYHRQATNLVITGGGDLRWATSSGNRPNYVGVTNAVTIGEGAVIAADAGAHIGLGSPNQVTVLGSIIAPGGSITLSADNNTGSSYGFSQPGQANVTYTTPAKSVWLGSDAVLDVSGIALTDPFATPVRQNGVLMTPVIGKILDGGSVALSDDGGYVVTEAGSIINVSGAAGRFDLPQAGVVGLGGQSYAAQDVWSNAGSITLAAFGGLYADGTLLAHAGAPQGEGGTLTILAEVNKPITTKQPDGTTFTMPSAAGLILQQSGDVVPSGLAPGQAFPNAPTGMLYFAADRLDGSGIGTLVVGGAVAPSGDQLPLVPVAFAGDVTLSLGTAVIINTSQLVALPAGATTIPTLANGTSSVGGGTVTIDAPYVAIAGTSGRFTGIALPTPASQADATLNINAGFIDLENQVSLANFSNASFTSSGDIRLSSTYFNNSGNGLTPGELYTPGNLIFKAADLYPSSGSTFVLDASGPNPTTITFLGNGTSEAPLSAGGSLLIDATNIVQAGTIRAPSGTIVLGVGDSTDNATKTQFGNLPLTNTNTVTLADGSVTSVSLDNAIIPYGTTIDGTEWQYNATNSTTNPDLAAPPAKVITVNGSDVSLNSGAVIDLSGGGDLQAIEWVAGNGGTRDLLSQYNVTFPASGPAVATPLYPDARNVYAILPGVQAPVAAYDPIYAQMNQASNQTASAGVGQAASGSAVGQSVYLAGVPGLPDGVYTLLPAKYATLPGAYRIVQNTGASNVAPGQSVTLADGTHVVSGYYVDGLNGSRDAAPSQFEVQSAASWGQYSQYSLTSADSFDFSGGHADGNTVPPRLPMDAGQLVLAATGSLTLDTTLKADAAPGGAASEVDIASQDIQIIGGNEPALAGYLQISADGLNQLGAGSLLIGGTRLSATTTDKTSDDATSGDTTEDDDKSHPVTTIDALANSVVISNDADHPLTGPEIILVTKTDASGTDANAVSGLRIDAGSVIQAKGAISAASDHDIILSDATGSGDGSLLMVTNGALVNINRKNLPTTSQASLTVGAGAEIDGGTALILDSSGDLSFDPAATFSGTDIAIDAGLITLTNATGAAAASLPGFVVGPTSLAQFANSDQVNLRSYSAIDFDGTVDLSFGEAVKLSAGAFVGSGGDVTLSGQQIAFINSLDATVPTSTAGTGTLTINAGEIDLGLGDKVLSGFSTVVMTASGGIVGQDTGSFDLGAADATLTAPLYLADTSSDATLKTSGILNLDTASSTALTRDAVGGALSFAGGTLNDNGAQILAPAGNISLEATSGDLTIGDGSLVSATGIAKQFFDITVYAPAGKISLTADAGDVNVESGATLDFSGNAGGGAAGSLTLSAPDQVVNLAGTIKGSAASGFLGGSFSLDTGGVVDLDNLAAELASSGVDDAITVQSGDGNLTLSAGNTITAHVVSLTADGGAGGQNASDGNVNINGTINASGNAGGEIDLYGKSGVDLEGSLIATGSSATQRGGSVNIGTVGNPDTDPVTGVIEIDPTYGYEVVSSTNSGAIKLGANALIDVSGGTAGGLANGTVSFRAPLLVGGDVNISIAPTAIIRGSRATTLEAYAVWSTDDPSTGAQHFDGIVDPAGWYNSTGTLVSGAFTDASGATVASWDGSTLTNNDNTTNDLSYYLSNDIFAPDAGEAIADHQSFYGYKNGDPAQGAGTLMSFVQNFPISSSVVSRFANVDNFAVTPGIELDNPDAAINNGNISVLTNWNLGSGSSQNDLDFRFNGQAPTVTFKAENDVKVDASLTDGFFQIANPTGNGISIQVGPYSSYQIEHDTLYAPGTSAFYYGGYYLHYAYLGLVSPILAPASNLSGTPEQIGEYYGLYSQYLAYLLQPTDSLEHPFGRLVAITNLGPTRGLGPWLSRPVVSGQPTLINPYPTTDNPTAYLKYLGAYNDYLDQEITFFNTTGQAPHLDWVMPPPAMLDAQVLAPGTSVVVTPVATANSPSPMPTAGNVLPLISASLMGGKSSTFNIVAGANASSANPLAVQAATLFGNAGGSVSLDGHFTYVDTNSQVINAPTMIRTGTGSIEIAAANDVSLSDATAPGVIYTAGAPATGAPVGAGGSILAGSPTNGAYDLLTTNAVNPDGAGDISIRAGGDITDVEIVGTFSPSTNSQFWWQWMQTGNTYAGSQITQTSINFGAFDQGIMSIGGNVAISAGGNIANLAVSLPTTWYLSNHNSVVNTVGGGNLAVTAGGSILSGDYFVAKGTGTLTAGGLIGSSGLLAFDQFGKLDAEVSTLLATQNGIFNVSARQGVDIGGIVNPSYVQGNAAAYANQHADAQSYSASSAVNVISTTGDVALNTLSTLPLIGALSGFGPGDSANVLPATVALTAFTGGITIARNGVLYPSATGQLSLIASHSIDLYNNNGNFNYFGLIDASAAALPSPLNPIAIAIGVSNEFDGDLTSAALIDHSQTPLHADDTDPVRIYSLNGTITDGTLETSGQHNGLYDDLLQISVDKPAQIRAGKDILNLAFLGQNLRDDDVTSVIAGRDIWNTRNFAFDGNFVAPSLVLGGPGTFDVEAGRNLGPFLNQATIYAIEGSSYTNPLTGIDAIGNAKNPYLAHESANVNVLFGTGKGIDLAEFIAQYIAPGANISGIDTTPDLIAFMEQYDEGQGIDTGLIKDEPSVTLTADQAWTQFQGLSESVQRLFAEQVLFQVLTAVGRDYHDETSPFANQYARGYQAISTLFPADLGYTANSLDGGNNGDATPVQTGNLDMRSSTIQTQQGGNVTILGPGGEALVGSTSAPPVITDSAGNVKVGPGAIGILTLEQGDVNIFTDQSLLLAQSRVFTEQGGDMTIWSSNGDINAGKGAKTVADVPPPAYVSDNDHYNTLDARGEVTGAGIATLPTIPGVPKGDIFLIAPRGTVDAGDAGIRFSGDIFVAALTVANANNFQGAGKEVGVPGTAVVDTGALSAAGNTAGAASNAANKAAKQTGNRNAQEDLPSIITVQVIGYGGDDEDGTPGSSPKKEDDKRKKKPEQQSSNDHQDPNSRVQVLAAGDVTEDQARQLADERRKLVTP